ncbi:MAG: hypothetical protein HY321_13920, partial [Armatimonadetes bacterium]|nr:hypothetical protein [Armatimonadota bacterium]
VNGLTPASTLLWSFRTRASGNGASLDYGFWSISNATWVVARTNSGVTGTDYTDVSVQFALPSGCTVGDPAFYCSRPSDSVYVDDVSLRQVVSAPSGDGVQLANPDGVTASIQSSPNTGQPYLTYTGSAASGARLGPREWAFYVPSGVSAFSFTVVVETNTALPAAPGAASGAGSSAVQVRTLAGTNAAGFRDGPATVARFGSAGSGIQGIAVDATGNLYVADAANDSIRRVGADGVVSTVAGIYGSGGGYVDGLGTAAKLDIPRGIAITSDGCVLYVADGGNERVRRIEQTGVDPRDPASWTVSTIAGDGLAGYDDGAGNVASFRMPYGLALESDTSLLITEYHGQRVRRIQLKGGTPTTAANWHVSLVAGESGIVSPTGAFQDGTGSAARFNHPAGITVDTRGNAYVADRDNHRVRRITQEGVVTTLAGSGTSGYLDSATGTTAQLNSPFGAAVDAAGYVFIADYGNHRIRRVGPSGAVTTVAGGTFGSADGTGDAARFASPDPIAVDCAGNVYVADSSGYRIRLIQRVVSTAAP